MNPISLILANKKIAIYIALGVIAFILLNKYKAQLEGWFKRTFGSSGGDYTEPCKVAVSSLSDLAARLYTAMYSTSTFTSREDLFKEAIALNDCDLDKLAVEYKQKAGNSLYTDVDNEIMPLSNEDETLMGRLSELNRK